MVCDALLPRSSGRIYYKRAHAPYGRQPPENFIVLRHIAERTNNIVRWTEFDRGGHSAALEETDLLVDDIRAFFRNLRNTPLS